MADKVRLRFEQKLPLNDGLFEPIEVDAATILHALAALDDAVFAWSGARLIDDAVFQTEAFLSHLMEGGEYERTDFSSPEDNFKIIVVE